jgi:GTP cyclohydrolase II
MLSPVTPATVRGQVPLPLRLEDGTLTEAQLLSFDGLCDGREHVAIALGDRAVDDLTEAGDVPLVRVHSECLTGDVLGSQRCDCGPQLREAIERITEVGGYLLYLRQEGRGIGLYNKLDAYALQDAGLDTYEANLALGLPEDARDYTAAAQRLTALGITDLNLLTNNPDKAQQLRDLGLSVTRTVPTGVHTTPSNLRYLHAKVQHTHHTIALAPMASLAV